MEQNIEGNLGKTQSILETDKQYFDKLYAAYKTFIHLSNEFLTETQFSKICHCFFVISQLGLTDYGEMLIYILKKNPSLIFNMALPFQDEYKEGLIWLSKVDVPTLNEFSYSHKNVSQSNNEQNMNLIKPKIRKYFTDLENDYLNQDESLLGDLMIFKNVRNDIKEIFNSTSSINYHLQRLAPFFSIRIRNDDIFVFQDKILMRPLLSDAIDFIKLNWSNKISTEMADSIFKSEFTTPEGDFSYFYISLYCLTLIFQTF